jgi:hypothetical protein
MGEDERYWTFTWGFGQGYDNCYTQIWGAFSSARTEMICRHGERWAFSMSLKKLLVLTALILRRSNEITNV